MNFHHHSEEDCFHYYNIQEKSKHVKVIANQYDDKDLKERARVYDTVVQGELNKYSPLIGKNVVVKDSGNSYKEYKIEKILQFTNKDILIGIKEPEEYICLTASKLARVLSELIFCTKPTRDGNINQEKP